MSNNQKRKWTSYTQFKLKLISFAVENSNRAAERKLSVSEKLVRDWRKAKISLEMSKSKRACVERRQNSNFLFQKNFDANEIDAKQK